MNKIIFFLSALIIGNSVHSKVIDNIVAIVNEEYISLSDLNQYRKQIKKQGLVDKIILSIKDPEKLVKDRQYLLDHLIDERLIDSEVKKQKVQATFEMVEKEIRKLTSQANISREQLKATLIKQGIKFSDYQDFIKTSIQRRKIIEKEVQSRIRISDDDITTYYISKFGANDVQAFEYTLSHLIFFRANGGDDAAKRRALVALKKLKAGTDFPSVASQYSEDPNFTSGGIMGTFKDGEMRPEVNAVIKNLKVGKHSDLIKTPFGYQVIYLNKKTLTESPKIQQKKQSIHAALMNEAIQTQLKLWLKRKRDLAFIRINK